MRRAAAALAAVAVVAVAYAAVVEGRPWERWFGWFGAEQRLPALRTAQLPFRYPAHLWQRGIEGEVLLRVHITAAGTVDSVELQRSSGHEELDSLAMHGAGSLEYHPARQGERGVAVWAVLPVRFERSAVESSAAERGE